MKVSHRVKDSDKNTIGFLIDGKFYSDCVVKQNLDLIENLTLLSNGVLRCNVELPILTWKEVNKRKYNKLVKENPFKRDIQKDLLEWKRNERHKVLQLDGSRQVGKTTELKKFAYRYYDYLIYVNLSNDTHSFSDIMLNNGVSPLSIERYCRNANLPSFKNNKNTLLIIDEIQTKYEIYNLIREFYSSLNCDIIVTGSYLGQTLKKEFFQPAGTVEYLQLFPLSFAEFLRVFNKENLLYSVDLYGSSDDNMYKILYDYYEIYRKIGGYPEVVSTYKHTKDISSCKNVIESLFKTFERESKNYFNDVKETLIFRTVYEEAVRLICSEKQGSGNVLVDKITNVVKESQKMLVNRNEIRTALNWVISAGILGDCDLYNNGDINDVAHSRRIYYRDSGLFYYIASQLGIETSNIEGVLTETFVYSELCRLYNERASKKKVKGGVPCFSLYNGYELDFVVLGTNNIVYGLETKTVKGNPISLKVFIDKHLIDKGYVAKKTKGGRGQTFNTIPIFSVGARFPYEN